MWDVRVRQRLPAGLRLRAGFDPGPPPYPGRIYALAHAWRRGWAMAPHGPGTYEVRPHPDLRLVLRWDRGYDLENAIEVFVDEVYAADVREKIVLDIGAGTGDAALYFLRAGARSVVAYEPNPATRALAAENLRGPLGSGTVELRPEAVAGGAGSREMWAPPGIPSAASLDPVAAARARWPFERSDPVAVTNLDAAVDRAGPGRVGLLKIDAQGEEYAILAAASPSTLDRLDAIVLEFTGGPRDLPVRLERAGFDVTVDGGERGYLRAVRRAPRGG